MHLIILPCSPRHGVFFVLLFVVFFILSAPVCEAQAGCNPSDRYDYRCSRFSPSMAVIVAVLISSVFFLGLFSIYIRHCSDAGNGRSQRRLPGMGSGRTRRMVRGLEASVIKTFPSMVYSEVKHHKLGNGTLECAVCLSEFEDHETLRLIPKCNHVFHTDCIDAWLARHTTCPVCRANLVPQPGDPVAQPIEFLSAESDLEAQDVVMESEPEDEQRLNANTVVESPAPTEVIDGNQTLNRSHTSGSGSSCTPKFPRSHTTGHSFVQPDENTDRFTLRLPVDVRKQVMNRQLNRSTSMMILPREGSARRGYRIGGEGSSRGKHYRLSDKPDRLGKSEGWVFSMTPPFFSRTSSIKSPKVAPNSAEATSALPAATVIDSVRPPV
ncbi:hypothetical protein SLA2020_293050 [Shorea laevis]